MTIGYCGFAEGKKSQRSVAGSRLGRGDDFGKSVLAGLFQNYLERVLKGFQPPPIRFGKLNLELRFQILLKGNQVQVAQMTRRQTEVILKPVRWFNPIYLRRKIRRSN